MISSKYEIKQEIGRGSYSIVYLAIDVENQGNVALKKIDNNGQRDMINNEQVILKTIKESREQAISAKNKSTCSEDSDIQYQLDHVLEIVDDCIIEEQFSYIVMKYYENSTTFTHFLKDNHIYLSERHILIYFHQLLSGLKQLHSLQISHRDLKLDNLLYCHDQDKLVIIDFGFAVLKQTQGIEQCGSKMYSSPQVILSMRYSPEKNDIWSMGVILYYLIFRRFPICGINSGNEGLKKSMVDFFNNKSEIEIDNCSSIVKELLKKMLTKFEQNRSSISDLYELLTKHLYKNNVQINPSFQPPSLVVGQRIQEKAKSKLSVMDLILPNYNPNQTKKDKSLQQVRLQGDSFPVQPYQNIQYPQSIHQQENTNINQFSIGQNAQVYSINQQLQMPFQNQNQNNVFNNNSMTIIQQSNNNPASFFQENRPTNHINPRGAQNLIPQFLVKPDDMQKCWNPSLFDNSVYSQFYQGHISQAETHYSIHQSDIYSQINSLVPIDSSQFCKALSITIEKFREYIEIIGDLIKKAQQSRFQSSAIKQLLFIRFYLTKMTHFFLQTIVEYYYYHKYQKEYFNEYSQNFLMQKLIQSFKCTQRLEDLSISDEDSKQYCKQLKNIIQNTCSQLEEHINNIKPISIDSSQIVSAITSNNNINQKSSIINTPAQIINENSSVNSTHGSVNVTQIDLSKCMNNSYVQQIQNKFVNRYQIHANPEFEMASQKEFMKFIQQFYQIMEYIQKKEKFKEYKIQSEIDLMINDIKQRTSSLLQQPQQLHPDEYSILSSRQYS